MPRIGGTEILTPTPAATIPLTIDPSIPQIIARWTAGQNETVSISGAPSDGQTLILIIINDATARTITLGAGMLGKGNIVGTINKKSVIVFVADNNVFLECSRSLGM